MKKLKKLDDDALEEIGNFLYDEIFKFVSSKISPKEINDIDIDLEISFQETLDISYDVSLDIDELSEYKSNIITEAIDKSFELLESYLDEHFRE
ncbi:MAG: DUF3194 domain-containing protein [Methanobrevibacter sp.]|jgi:hypothetical protein|nr:DUF3194 domain-containing protein [Methanobrevibacter sp.]